MNNPQRANDVHKLDYHATTKSVHILTLRYGIDKCIVMLQVKYCKHMFVRKKVCHYIYMKTLLSYVFTQKIRLRCEVPRGGSGSLMKCEVPRGGLGSLMESEVPRGWSGSLGECEVPRGRSGSLMESEGGDQLFQIFI